MRSIFRFVCMSESRQQGSFMSSSRLEPTKSSFQFVHSRSEVFKNAHSYLMNKSNLI